MKRKGFTLIELLAVIVILAIIALIAIPNITKVVEESRKGAAKSSALGYIDAVEKYVLLHGVNPTKYPYDLKGKTMNVSENNETGFLDIFISRVYAESETPILNNIISVNGEKPTRGTVTINNKGKVTEAELLINKYNVIYDGSEVIIGSKSGETNSNSSKDPIVTYNANGGSGTMESTTNSVAENTFTRENYEFVSWNTKSDGTGETYTTESEIKSKITLYAIWRKVAYAAGDEIIYNPETNAVCDNPVSTPETKKGCMKWYVIKDNGNSVDVILDHNTTAKVAWVSKEDYIAAGGTEANYGSYGNPNKGPITAKKQIASDTSSWTSGLNPRLITAYEIANVTNTPTFNGTASTHFYINGTGDKKQTPATTPKEENPYAWLITGTYNYWTSSYISGGNTAWSLDTNGFVNYFGLKYDNYFGVRPVITIQKSVLE